MQHLFECWEPVAARLRNAEAIALFLDFDGTLAELRSRPEEASLKPATRRALMRLAHHPRLRIWVISGRRRADIQRRIGVPGVRYLGLHGWESNRNGDAKLTNAARGRLAQIRSALTGRIAQSAGLWMEDKEATLALHYRGAAEASVTMARATLREVLRPFAAEMRVIEGKKVWEMLPRELGGKGAVVRREWCTFRRRALPVYVGDDAGDEGAFAALGHGITVRVGPAGFSRARLRLSNPAEVRRFLEKVQAELSSIS